MWFTAWSESESLLETNMVSAGYIYSLVLKRSESRVTILVKIIGYQCLVLIHNQIFKNGYVTIVK